MFERLVNVEADFTDPISFFQTAEPLSEAPNDPKDAVTATINSYGVGTTAAAEELEEVL